MSGATSRRKGNAYECAVAAWLRSKGFRAITSRDARGGSQGGADVITDFPTTIECKNHAKLDLAGWIDQAVNDAAGDPAAVWVKRRGKGDVGESYVVMRADDFVALVRPDTSF
ncbi:MAG: hypothetical protein LC679_06850 [Intrasporangiaceae bacterium]|nr:hypothetical protein [Intrasporangiaceae bacterium]